MAPKRSGRASAGKPNKAATSTTSIPSAPAPTTEHQSSSSVTVQPVGSQTTAQLLMKALELIVLGAAYSTVSQLCLSPVYGSIPPSLHHSRITMAAVFAAWLAKSAMGAYIRNDIVNLLPVFAFMIPPIQFFLFQHSEEMGPIYGPLVTELVTYFPLAALSMYAAAVVIENVDLSRFDDRVQNSGPAVATYFVFTATEKLTDSYIRQNVGSGLIFTRAGLQFVAATFYALLLPSRAIVFAVLPILHSASVNIHVPLDHTTSVLNDTLHTHNYSLVARQESLTGYVSVLDNLQDNFRVMRCDHSLLGGEWTPPTTYGRQVKEPIYSVFTLLEAVRLVETESGKKQPVNLENETNALVMYVAIQMITIDNAKSAISGLGIGTTPAALIAHGISTTIIEIDPVVHSFATQYFALPTNHTSIIEDATSFVDRARLDGSEHHSYDYIIHDVFTSGAEPASLFTQEFIQGVSDLLKPEGVVAINYAGDLALPSARLVVNTIKSVFPSCRLFREENEPSTDLSSGEQPSSQDFTNMVLFCRKTTEPFSFRAAAEADCLGSQARRSHLQPKHEIAADFFGDGPGKVLRRGKTEALQRWQRESAVGHWRIMRKVLPAVVWESW
ncbi:hypothetical protein MMC26_007158 [Xylographa opegraphella]|nr:hypothetical protein [Xylographa opegraphella]